MEATRSAKKGGNPPSGEFNYYQDLDTRIDNLMEELRAVRNVRPTPPAPSEISENCDNKPRKQKPAST